MFNTFFKGRLRAIRENDFEAFGISKASIISCAKTLLPSEYSPSDDIDILPVVFDLALVNKFNENGDGISAADAQKIVKKFIHRPFNVEHKKDKIVGHIVNASLSLKEHDFQEHDTDFSNVKEPFYLNCAAYIYRHVYNDLAESIEDASEPDSENFLSISTSWEIGFRSYSIAVGSKDLAQCEIITDPKQIMKYRKFLKSEGGSGVDEMGRPVGRLVNGEIFPLGAALTTNPAANVRGVFPIENEMEDENDDLEEENSSIISKNTISNVVNKRTNLFMDKEQFEQFMQALEKLAASKSEVLESKASIGDFREVIKEAIFEQTKGWESDLSKEKAAKEEALANLSKVTEELSQIKANLAVKEAADAFNARVSWVEDTFSFDEDQLKVIVAEIKDIPHDADFEPYKNKLSVLFASKNKETLAKLEEEKNKAFEEAVASKLAEINKTDSKEEELEVEIKEGEAGLPNGSQPSNETLLEKVKKSFEVKVS